MKPNIESTVEHFANAVGSGLKFLIHFAAVAAPIAASVAAATGHGDVVGDINKAGDAARAAQGLSNAFEEVK